MSGRVRPGLAGGRLVVVLLATLSLAATCSSGRQQGEAVGGPAGAGGEDVSANEPDGAGGEDTRQPETPTRQVAQPVEVELRARPSGDAPGQPRVAPAPGVPSPLPKLERDVKLDLGRRLGIDISEIEVVSADAVTWPDTSLGCPGPGLSYPQMLTEGYRILLRARGSEYRYHTSLERFVRCGG